MNPQDIKEAANQQLLDAAKEIQSIMERRDIWISLYDQGLIPEVPEAKSWNFSTQMWPLYLYLPLNKVILTAVCKRFEAHGWKVDVWNINAAGVSFNIKPSGEWGWDLPFGIYISVSTQGVGDQCKLVVIDEQETTQTRKTATYELVCEAGAAEIEAAAILAKQEAENVD